MRVQNDPPLHLTYCLNIHPGETWAENFTAIRTHALAVKQQVCPDAPFGLGLRLSNQAAHELAEESTLAEFKAFLADNDLYVFTINGFPYGTFHGEPVKSDVYRPDWRTPERRDYTNLLADILAALLPEGVAGSISTVPLAYKLSIPDTGPLAAELRQFRMADILMNVAHCVEHLEEILERTGRRIVLAFEPEPDCLLENTSEVMSMWSRLKGTVSEDDDWLENLRRHVGVCVDLCHVAVAFEDPAESIKRLADAGIPIAKVQLSAALRCGATPDALAKLRDFVEPVYLHQVKVRRADGRLFSYDDLGDALSRHEPAEDDEWRIHFHVPLYLAEYGELRSTNSLYTPELARLLLSGVTEHLEIETYTFDVLPEAVRGTDVTRNIAREYDWVLAYLG